MILMSLRAKRGNLTLLLIIIVAAVLRLINLGSGDITGSDEVFYVFRGLGMLDFDNSPAQPSVWELLEQRGAGLPAWARLSFSDHPPLIFLVENISMKVFGENNSAFRLPSAILGIASVYLLYLIARRIFNEKTAIVAAAVYAVTLNAVYISRLALQEAAVILFLLLSTWLFLKALDNDRWLPWLGVSVGLGLLAKYTAFIVVPIFISYLILRRRDVFRNKKFWLAIVLALVMASPIFIYNYNLYQTFGHFDFQLSYLFGQDPAVWQSAPGKAEIGSLTDRLINLLPNFYKTNGWGFASLFLIAIIIWIWQWIRRPKTGDRNTTLVVFSVFWLTLLLLFIGPTNRFLAMLTPFAALLVAWLFLMIDEKWMIGREKLAFGFLGIFLTAATLYSINSLVINYPTGAPLWMWSRVRFDNYNWGYNELEKYLANELRGKRPAISFNMPYQFLQKIGDRESMNTRNRELRPYPALIIYDNNIHSAAQLWSLDRRQIYHNWPTLKTEDYLNLLAQKGTNFFNQSGFRSYYFIIPTESVPWKNNSTDFGTRFEKELVGRGVAPEIIKNKRGEEVFHIYKF